MPLALKLPRKLPLPQNNHVLLKTASKQSGPCQIAGAALFRGCFGEIRA